MSFSLFCSVFVNPILGQHFGATKNPPLRGAGCFHKLPVNYWPVWQTVVNGKPWKLHQLFTDVEGVCPKYFKKTRSCT